MNSFDEVFSAVKEYCKERVVFATYNLFIDGIVPVSFDGVTVVIKVRSAFIKDTLEKRYVDLLCEGFKELLGFEINLEIEIPESGPVVELSPEERDVPAGSYAFNFDNFIVGSTNKFAHAAALAVASNPSGTYNPLFIYGDSGLGKTHLLNAIRFEIQNNHPDFTIIYVDGEAFTNEIIQAIRSGSTVDFQNKYRKADVLLVDDIQFIGGKESTQEEFFHTFNTLYNANKQIVLASDRPPKEIKSLEDRLRTRFEWGLTADVQKPDFETRCAIINRKSSLLKMDLPDEVTEFVATRLKNNIRQLEGAVKKINAYRLLEGIKPSISSAQNAIKDILNETQPIPVTIDKIVSEVARTFSITPEDIRSRKRSSNISNARKAAMYVVREITGMSMEDIGSEFGGRDHSTVVYSLNEVKEKMETDTRLKEVIEDMIKNARS